jgi:hypothetical protein
MAAMDVLGRVLRGVVAGAVGTLAMDIALVPALSGRRRRQPVRRLGVHERAAEVRRRAGAGEAGP